MKCAVGFAGEQTSILCTKQVGIQGGADVPCYYPVGWGRKRNKSHSRGGLPIKRRGSHRSTVAGNHTPPWCKSYSQYIHAYKDSFSFQLHKKQYRNCIKYQKISVCSNVNPRFWSLFSSENSAWAPTSFIAPDEGEAPVVQG